MSGHRVVVTGVGVVSPFGAGREAFWKGLEAGRSCIRPIESADTSGLTFSDGAEVSGLDLEAEIGEEYAHTSDRFAQLLLVAAREAVAHSGLEPGALAGPATAIVTGSAIGGKATEDAAFKRLYAEGKVRPHPLSIPRAMSNGGASLVSMDLGITGPTVTFSTACSSANHAIGHALDLVRHGRAERALAGGSEAPFNRGHLAAWSALRVVSRDTCRPFSADRSGMSLGEGAGVLVLERLEAARARGAKIYAELAGFGMTSDASHITQPTVEGPAAAIRAALADADLEPEAVGYVNAHGTGTRANDPIESSALHAVFGAHAKQLAVSSTKSMHGHALGAAGALEGVATVLALAEGLLPPTANFTTADPECDLDVVPNAARQAEIEAALSNSFAFGGLNAVLAFRRAPGDA